MTFLALSFTLYIFLVSRWDFCVFLQNHLTIINEKNAMKAEALWHFVDTRESVGKLNRPFTENAPRVDS